MNKNQIDKVFFIEKIKEAESKAKEMLQLQIEHDFHGVEENSINESHKKELVSKVLARYINDYHRTKNYYKAACDSFAFLKNKKSDLTEDDRIDFVAVTLESSYKKEAKTNLEKAQRLELLSQLMSIENIVFDTHLIWLKRELAIRSIMNLESENDFDSKYFDESGWRLFSHLTKNYNKTGKVKYINIWYFLKRVWKKEHTFRFEFTQKDYKDFVLKNYGVQIKKFAKADYKFDDDEVPYLEELARELSF